MSPRDSLLEWLRGAAKRAWRQQCLREGAWGIAGVSAVVALHEILRRCGTAVPVMTALRPLLVLAALTVVIVVAVRTFRRPALEDVAAAADARAGLHDELLSAQWFARTAVSGGLVDLHLGRAADAARALDLRTLFPLRIPRPALAITAVAIVIAGGAAAWPVDPPGERQPEVGPLANGRIAPDREATTAVEAERPADGADGRGPNAAQREQGTAWWQQVESLAKDLVGRPAGQSLAEAIAARDARAAARALRATRDAAKIDGGSGAIDTPGEQMNDTMAKDILARLSALLQQEENAPGAARSPAVPDGDRPTAQLDRELRQDDADAQRGARREQTPGEDAVNTSLRALSRSSTGGRDAVHGEADSTEGAGRANVSGGAMGRRINTSTAGSGEGDQPTGNAAPPPVDDTVLGSRTQRLAVQLKSVQVNATPSDENNGDEDPAGTEESFYAATRAQAARVALSSGQAVSRAGAEDATAAERSPLEYREAVKRYTLARHRREPDPNRAAGGQR